MKIFSDFEKEIINKIIEIDNQPGSLNILSNILDSFFNSSGIYYIEIESEEICTIKLTENVINKIGEYGLPQDLSIIIKDIITKLLLVFRLFEYLDKNNYILLYDEIDISSLGTKSIDDKYIDYDNFSQEIKKLIYKYSRKKILATIELKNLIKNNFKSIEDIYLINQLNTNKYLILATLVTIIISIFGSIIIPIYFYNNDNKNTIIIDKKNLNEIVDILKNNLNDSNTTIISTQNLNNHRNINSNPQIKK